MTVFKNYIIEISADNVRYTTIADYSQGGSVPHITDGANTSDIAFIPADYNITRKLYIRIRNCRNDQGYGGSIKEISYSYFVTENG